MMTRIELTKKGQRIAIYLFIICLVSDLTFCESLSFLFPKRVAAQPVKKVAIIGSGISGLAVAHALINNSVERRQSDFQIEIYDARKILDPTVGAGVQLSGGLAVLGKINPVVQEAVFQAGIPLKTIQSQCKPWFRTATSTENMDQLLKVDLKEAVESAGGDATESLIASVGGSRQLCWIGIMRGTIQEVLLKTLPKNSDKVKVHLNKKFSKLTTSQRDWQGSGVMCRFEDGSETGPFDLVIGCDGINSSVKSYIDETNKNTPKIIRSAIYSGIRIRYAVSDRSEDNPENDPQSSRLSQYFGDGVYALHGVYGAGDGIPAKEIAYLIYLDQNFIGPFKKKDKPATDKSIKDGENADWTQDNREAVYVARSKMIQQLRECGIPTNDDDFLHRTIASASRFFELGVYFHNPLGRWSRKVDISTNAFTVLVGDSAHAFPPFLGQGANQAIQDAYCLTSKIYEYNEKVFSGEVKYADELHLFLNDYQKIRFPATAGIFWKSALLGYLETGGSDGLYSKFRDSFFQTMGRLGVARRILLSSATPKIK